MKLSRFLAAALIASFTLVSAAHATDLSATLGTVNKTTPSGLLASSAVSKNLVYDIDGSLAKNTEITFTLTSNSIPAGVLVSNGSLGSASGTAATSTGSLVTVGALPVIATANLTGGIATITIANLTSSAEKFAADFLATITQGKGSAFNVSYVVSAVPLPSALVLFAVALIALAGMGMSKKSRNQI